MAMVGKRFQRTISMSQIQPPSSLHAEKAQAQNHYQQQQREVGEHPQWDILKNAEAMMMMMMAASGGNAISEEGLERQTMLNMAAATANKNDLAQQHPHTGVSSYSPAVSTPEHHIMSSPAALVLPTHHFLEACFFCKRRLRPERDIFIYRGDAAFCTEECRHRQIVNDEAHS